VFVLTSTATRVRGAVHEEAARRWGVRNTTLVDVLFALPFAGAVVVIASWADRPLFHLLTDDDRVLEWLQFAFYAVATVLGAAAALALWRLGNRLMALLFAAFAAGCLFITGEEVSWGQRVFGWSTPETLSRINNQGETTIHNIGSFSTSTNAVMLLMGAYGAAAPWLLRRYPRALPEALTRFVVPPLFLSSAFLLLLAYKAIRFVIFPQPQSATVSFGEWPELCLAVALMTFALLVRRRLSHATSLAHAPVAGHAPGPAAQAAAPPASRVTAMLSRRARHSRSNVT
jgi:hypothetical protein